LKTNEEVGGEDTKAKSARPILTYMDASSETHKKQKKVHQHLFPVGQNIETVSISGICIGLEPQDPLTKVFYVTPSSKDKTERVGNRYHYGPEKCDTKRSTGSRPLLRLRKRDEGRGSDCREGVLKSSGSAVMIHNCGVLFITYSQLLNNSHR
jgi:hypothetical protein